MHHILPDGGAVLAGQDKRMRRFNSVKNEKKAQAKQFKGTLVFSQREKTAGFRLRSSGHRPETVLASAFIPPFSLFSLTLLFSFYYN